MNEDSLSREPIELVEIVLPKCANTYGVAPCTASGGVGSECYNCRATCQDVANYDGSDTDSLWLGRGVAGEPTDEKYIFPCLGSTGTIGTKVNLSGSDDDYKPLGRRATLDFSAADFNHSDITQDPYFATRKFDPSKKGTFWPKWLARQRFGKVGARVNIYDGYAGQPLSAYLKRGYVLEDVTRREDGVSFYCRDELARAEGIKSLVPKTSAGILSADISASDTSFTMLGQFTDDEYPTAGTVRISDEVMTYTSKSYDGGANTTTIGGLTRGTDGSTASTHATDDAVQICRRFTDETVASVVKTLLLDDAGIDASLVDETGIDAEQSAYLAAYDLNSLITEPTAVDTVLGWVTRETSCFVYWDERSQKVRLRAIRAVAASEIIKTLSHEENILSGSMKLSEKPRQRLNVVNAYFGPIDVAGDLDKPANYRNGLQIVNGTTSLPEQYGNFVQSREIFFRFLATESDVRQTVTRLSLRYADVPQFAEFYVDAKDRSLWVGDVVRISHPLILDRMGSRDLKRWLVIEAEEVDPGHLVRYVCADITLDGFIYVITENDVTEYDPELFLQGKAFITDNNGLNPDGSTGATIS